MLSSAAVAMQSIFQLPWTCDPARDKQPKLDQAQLYQPSRVKPALDIPFITSAKRKRVDTTMPSTVVTTAPQQKRFKVASVMGAVQPLAEHAREVDGFMVDSGLPTLNLSQGEERAATCNMPENGLIALAAPTGGLVLEPAHSSRASDTTATKLDPLSSIPACSVSSGSCDMPLAVLKPTDTATPNEALDMSSNSNLDRVRSVVAAHIDLEILMKHNELRLIEQELAKCQIALEQIRRCDLIPYPGSQGFAANVAGGIGAALQPSPGFTSPRYPTPFGVNDGPYTRHYAQWLIPDSSFDSQVVTPAGPGFAGLSLGSRSGRSFAADFHLPPTPVGRGSRNSGGNKSHLLATESSQPNRDPLLMKREMDGQWVRLVCTKCKPERANFQNIQGFLNHCRISHQDNYKSHEQAAIACGRPVDVDESSMPPPPAPSVVAKHRATLPLMPLDTVPVLKITPGNTPVAERPTDKSFISSNLLSTVQTTQGDQAALRKLVLPRTANTGSMSQVSTPTTEFPESPFTASPQTPHLNELLKRRHFPGDFRAVVAETKQKVDTSLYDCSDSDVDNGNTSKRVKQKKARASIDGPKHSQAASGRKSNDSVMASKQAARTQRGQPSLDLPGLSRQRDHVGAQELQTPVLHHHIPLKSSPSSSNNSIDEDMELSPGTGMDSNPGLVSDHEGESDDADDDAVVDPSAAQPYAKVSSMASQRQSGNIRTQTFGPRHDDMMDIDNYVEIHHDISDTERDTGSVRVRESSGVEVACSSRGVHAE